MRKAKNEPRRPARAQRRGCFALSALLSLSGLLCALLLGGLFYLIIVWQHGAGGADVRQTAVPHITADSSYGEGADGSFPAAQLELPGEELAEVSATEADVGGESCRVVTRKYALADGKTAYAVSAWPAAYLEWMAVQRYTPQLVTGYVIGELDAVYALRSDSALLCARSGEAVYLLLSDADENELYRLGAAAVIGK